MKCSMCGEMMPPEAARCPNCGAMAVVPPPPPPSPRDSNTITSRLHDSDIKPPTSHFAVAGLILGGLACILFWCGGALPFGVPSIVLGHKAWSDIRKSNNQLGGKGMAVAALLLGYASLVLFIAFFKFVVKLFIGK